jgi:hypothetical protein
MMGIAELFIVSGIGLALLILLWFALTFAPLFIWGQLRRLNEQVYIMSRMIQQHLAQSQPPPAETDTEPSAPVHRDPVVSRTHKSQLIKR